MKRVLTVAIGAAMLFGGLSVTPANASCVSTNGTCPGRPGGRGEPGFGGGGGGGGGGGTSAPSISVKNLSKAEGTSQNETEFTEFKVSVVLSHPSDGVVKVDYFTSPGSAAAGDDYLDKTGTVSFPAGTTAKKITIDVRPDFSFEQDEQFSVVLGKAKGGKVKDGEATVTIRNDDLD